MLRTSSKSNKYRPSKVCLLYYAFLMDPFTIFMSSTGLSFLSVSTNPILFTIVIPEWILPVNEKEKM